MSPGFVPLLRSWNRFGRVRAASMTSDGRLAEDFLLMVDKRSAAQSLHISPSLLAFKIEAALLLAWPVVWHRPAWTSGACFSGDLVGGPIRRSRVRLLGEK